MSHPSYPKNKGEQAIQGRFQYLAILAVLCAGIAGLALLLKGGLKWRLTSRGVVQFPAAEIGSSAITPKGFVDLRAFYNAGLKTNWMGDGKVASRDLARLPTGVTSFGGVPFQVQNVIQLRGAGQLKDASTYPEKVTGIPVRIKCSKLHFLHGTCSWVSDAVEIAVYRVRFADGSRSEIPVLYGRDVRDWSFDSTDPNQGENTAWESREGRFFLRLYRIVWQNPKPHVEIKELEFVSRGTACYPFLLAITVE